MVAYTPPVPTIHELTTDADLTAAAPLMRQLRTHLPPGEAFVAIVRRQQRDHGYALFGGTDDDGSLVVLAGVRPLHTLSRGPHLFVDDLVTAAAAHGRGHGTAMLRHLARHAVARGLPRLCLDSRDTARTFYERIGFTLHTAVPCSIDVAALLGADPVRER